MSGMSVASTVHQIGMSKELGCLLITIGMILVYGGFSAKELHGGIFGFTVGPALISYGVQLVK